jgi:tetratricopeptide (TPR) repeat protein
MLFDLTSPRRKTAVRIVFGFLALIFAGGFIFLGIGTEGGLNPFDSVGGGSTDDAFEQQIEDAEKAVEADPEDADALATLALLRFQSGQAQLDVDETTGVPTLTQGARDEFEESVSIWQEYLDNEPKQVDIAAANAAVQAFIFLEDINGVIAAQQALADSDPTGTNLAVLANYLYRDLQIDEADKVRDEALKAADADEKKLLAEQLDQIRKQAVKAEEAQKKAEKNAPKGETGTEGSELSDPFGGFGGSDPAGTLPGTTPAP